MSAPAGNFDFLKAEPRFASFADIAASAEHLLAHDENSAVIACRRALECAVRWLYSVDESLQMPWDDKLASMLCTEEFRRLGGEAVFSRADFIRRVGNLAVHTHKPMSKNQALLCLENLHVVMSFIARCYSRTAKPVKFRADLAERWTGVPAVPVAPAAHDPRLEELLKENSALREQLTALRREQQQTAMPAPPNVKEFETRRIYIDTMLQEAGWQRGHNWVEEVELSGLPTPTGIGYADYVLYDDAMRPLAVVEAKRCGSGVEQGRQQAKLYADALERKYGRRPVVFLTNGFETRIDDNFYPERRVAAIYSKRDLEKLFGLATMRSGLSYVSPDKNIAGRYYQINAVKAVCDSWAQHRRRALLVMATGSGKTRTVISLCKVLIEQGWVKNILFLADRTALVTQAKRAFTALMPDLSLTNLCEDKDNYNARCVFSTYMTMMSCIDSVQDENGKLFTCGHFDLVVCDEAHRSIYNKYRDIFSYFDAPLMGLTATPKDEVDKNTYDVFGLEAGAPTYGYELAQAVKDGYLVDYTLVETSLKFLTDGIVFNDLSSEEQSDFEMAFGADDDVPDDIAPSALNSWVFNADTIRQVLAIVMQRGYRVDYGEKLGKTIIFARNHEHAERILKIFHEEYPHLPGNYAQVIDNHIKFPQALIDDFSDAAKYPQIAVSVDMMDTGIDVPEVLNLVFFKKVMSKAKFGQMIGRGTRLCPGLMDGEDKKNFYIFDFCGNFSYFRMKDGEETPVALPLQGALFHLKAQIAFKLQDLAYQTEPLQAFRQHLVGEMLQKVRSLNRHNFAVAQHLKWVERFSQESAYLALTYEDTVRLREELAPLAEPDEDEANALRFDALMYGLELAYLAGEKNKLGRACGELRRKVAAVAGVANIPAVLQQRDLLQQVLHTGYLQSAGINEFEHIRTALRELMKYLPRSARRYDVDFKDAVLGMNVGKPDLPDTGLETYRAKAESYVRTHLDNVAIDKLKHNIPLSADDVNELQKILWSEVGSREAYEQEFSGKPLGEFVREIVGLDMASAKAAFAEFLDETRMDSNQIYFVNQIVEYVVQNGLLKEFSVFQDAPFNDNGSIIEVFADDAMALQRILGIVRSINKNAAVA